MQALKKTFNFLASYGLACVLFILLFLLTFLGTLYQVDHGLFAAQKKYFESIVLVHQAFGFLPIPLPGGYLVMSLLFINLLLGGFLRLREGWVKLGVAITHFGMCMLIAGSYITFRESFGGHLTFNEGETQSEFISYHEWEIAVTDVSRPDAALEYLIQENSFARFTGESEGTFNFGDLPFTLKLSRFTRNAALKKSSGTGGAPTVDGYYLEPQPEERDDESNDAGAYIQVFPAQGEAKPGLLWGQSRKPFSIELDGRTFTFELRKRRFPIPFALRLDKFTFERHPGTMMAKVYRSSVTKIEGGVEEAIEITMNEPLRHLGYTFYQSSYGPPNAKPGDRMYSVLAVVRNPADQVPLYSCLVIAFGMVAHFLLALFRYLRRETRKSS